MPRRHDLSSHLRPRWHALAGLVLAGVGPGLTGGCDSANEGLAPPRDQIFFPSGLLLDPRADPETPARYLFISNGNNDLSYNSGTVLAVDLDAFFAAWSAPGTYAADPYCRDEPEPGVSAWPHPRCIGEVGSGTPVTAPCRRLSLLPQVIECDETPFIGPRRIIDGTEVGVGDDSVVAIGDFATVLTSSCEDGASGPDRKGCDAPRLWVPVRGDPSLTWVDVQGEPDQPPVFACGQGSPNPDSGDADPRCDRDHRLTHLRNDPDLAELEREPFNMIISPSQRYAYVAHADGGVLSLVSLDGVDGSMGPAIVDAPELFGSPLGFGGGFGLAERPCDPALAPSITLGCSRPLVYASHRYQPLLVSFTAQGVALDPDDPVRSCAGPDEVGDAGKIPCEPRVRSQQLILPGGLDPSASSTSPVLGDLAFADPAGDELLVVQTGPGALLRLNTRVGNSGEPFDTPSGPPLELCEDPTRMRLYEEDGKRYALVSCFRAALIYIVDLQSFRVVDAVVAGTGPYELEIDRPRRLLYVANNLESSISVIDLARDRPTRFREIARIGLQEPFSR